MFGTELGFPELQRLLEERQGQVQLPGSLIRRARLFMLVSVSGCSGPSLAFLSFSVSSIERQGQVQLPGSLIRHGEVVHADECVGMFGAELGFPELERLLESGRARSSFPAS